MHVRRDLLYITGLLLFTWMLASCAPAMTPEQVSKTVEVEKVVTADITSLAQPTQAPASTQAPAVDATAAVTSAGESPVFPQPTATPAPLPTLAPSVAVPTSPLPTQSALVEERVVEIEWPERMRLGESDVVRLALIPSSSGYSLTTEFPEHPVITQTVTIPRPGGYDLFAVARLDGVGFSISPSGEQVQFLPPEQALGWRWSIQPQSPGKHRLSIMLSLRWLPVGGGSLREVSIYSAGLSVQVMSFFGLSQSQAMLGGFAGLIFGGSLSLFAIAVRPRQARTLQDLREQAPNPGLAIELPAGLGLTNQERALLQSLFSRYARLVIEQEFLSGYSGARTFLALPIRPDGRADAYTIAKLGELESIRGEFANYETFVKDTLPPITARIQHPPVTTPGATSRRRPGALPSLRLAALQYTFIGEPGSIPTSLRQTLLADTDSRLLYKLLDTFGPNWWLQRRPHTFRLGLEYDRVLPTHLVLEPADGSGTTLDGRTPPGSADPQVGEILSLRNFPTKELRADGRSLSLLGSAAPGQPALRARWLSLQHPEGATGRVVATRQTLLRQFCAGCNLLGLPDPLLRLPDLLGETVAGSQSTIHGDLNLENILVGPGDLLWLIDFAQTRDGHTLYDFAHLEAEIIAHIIAPHIQDPQKYLDLLNAPASSPHAKLYSLLETLHEIASRCLFNPSQPREYYLVLTISCLGALKFANLEQHAKHLLYLTAAHFAQDL